ncbi:MAG: sulfatase-like hydrolase/transferase, partial [Deltaproteobacteria bacterium]|nr:sulfatase-like hydrolase/transferase [Deltaproteobacteria bacterium]
GCTIRADQTTLHTPGLDTTPFLAELASRGARFTDVIAAAPWTRPSSAALITGRHPAAIGMVEPLRKRNDRKLPEEVKTLAEVLSEGGYTTLGVTANPNVDAFFGFDQGFDAYTSLSVPWRYQDAQKVTGKALVEATLAEVRERADPARPVYLQVMLVDAHQPSHLPPREVRAFEAPGVPPHVADYRAMLRAFDRSVHALHSGLTDLGITEENAIFMVISDHGEGLGVPAHHGRGHGRYLYPSTVQLVWVTAGVGVATNHEIGGVASGVDLLPTVLGLVDLPEPEGVSGDDWSTQMGGDSAKTTRRVAWTDTRFLEVDRSGVYTTDRACFVLHDARSVQTIPGRGDNPTFVPGCFDRSADPDFTEPFPDEDLEAELRSWRREVDGKLSEWSEQVEEATPEELQQALEALGYAE